MLTEMKNYPRLGPSETRLVAGGVKDGLEDSLHIFQTPFGYQRAAELYRPVGGGPYPAILYIHWYEPQAPDSNRSQFEAESIEFSKLGAVCLAVETLWSDRDFFFKRTQVDDERNSVEEVVNLRRFMDFLLNQPGVDPGRFALVGHDFGGMYGALAGSLDGRPSHYVIMAATPRFPNWYLYLPKLEGEAREAYIQKMAPIDPITHIANLSPAPILFQFGDNDLHVSLERAEEFFEAAREPKEKRIYSSGHGLTEEASADRKAWLKEKLGL
jgi:dienelactone hydrolase